MPDLSFTKRINIQDLVPLLILFILLCVLTALNRDFISLNTALNLMQQVSAVGVVAIGGMIVIISGGIDFTAGYGLAMIGMLAGTIFARTSFGNSALLITLVCLFGGAALGLVNGFLIARFNLVPFIATLAVMSLAQGMSTYIGNGNMVLIRHEKLLWIGQGKIGMIPVSFIIFLLVCVIAVFLLKKTKFGVYTYAIGSNEEASRYVGIDIVRYKTLVYLAAGVCTGIGALLTITKIGMAAPSIYGSTLLDAIAAATIGGTSLSGGKGRVFGTFIGAIIIVLITTALTYLKIKPELQDVFKGAVILFAIGFDAILNKLTKTLFQK